jgi:hypothetical protein
MKIVSIVIYIFIMYLSMKTFASCPAPATCHYGGGSVTWTCTSASSSQLKIDTLPFPENSNLAFYNDPSCNSLAAEIRITQVPFSHSNLEIDGVLGGQLLEFNKSVTFHFDFFCKENNPCLPPPQPPEEEPILPKTK